MEFGVLGPVMAWDDAGDPLPLRGRHRAVLARLVVARGRVVPRGVLIEDLWDDDPPPGALGALQTFVSALRRALEPGRAPHSPARLLVTEGSGYALRATSVDAWRFARAAKAARMAAPHEALAALDRAAEFWRGPAYADLPDQPWVRAERTRLTQLRCHAVELRGAARLDLGRAPEAVADLDAHVADHPWREEGWRLLALALYRSGRAPDARRAAPRAVAARRPPRDGPGAAAARAGDRHPPPRRAPDRGHRVEPGRHQLRPDRAARVPRPAPLHGGPDAHHGRRGWPRGRAGSTHGADPGGAGARRPRADGQRDRRLRRAGDLVALRRPRAGRRDRRGGAAALAALPADTRPRTRARLLATIALESRGDPTGRPAAEEAERIARGTEDPALLAFALNGVFMQSFHRTGLADRRDAIGAELIDLSTRHDLPTYELLGLLVRMQARGALGDPDGADRHADAADRLAERHESPLVGVITAWHRAMRVASGDHTPAEVERAYRDAAAGLDGAGMPDPPPDHLQEALWCLVARAADAVDERDTLRRALSALEPAVAEIAGAGSGLVTLGPVARRLDEIRAALAV